MLLIFYLIMPTQSNILIEYSNRNQTTRTINNHMLIDIIREPNIYYKCQMFHYNLSRQGGLLFNSHN